MYKAEYMPVVTSYDLFEAINKRFGRSDISLSDLFKDEPSDDGIYPYWLNRENEIGKMSAKEAMTYMMVKQTLNKDFRVANKLVLVDTSW